MNLKKYQIEGAEFLSKNPHALLADDMGLGKTAQAIEACRLISIYNNILVICPASVKYHWVNEFRKWSIINYSFNIVIGRMDHIPSLVNIIIVNYELLLSDFIFSQIQARSWNVVICDEAHYLKTLTSKRSKRVLGRGGLIHNAKYKWMLTGTPIENRPVDLFPMLYVLGRHVLGKYNTYEKFIMRYCNGYYDAYTGDPMPDGASNEEELGERLKSFMLRRTLAHELPETTIQIIPLRRNEMIQKFEQNLNQESYYKPMAELGALASVRQEVALAKLPQCIEYIKDVLQTIDKVVVFAYHRSVINQLDIALSKFFPSKYYGGMTIRQKEKAVNSFKELKSSRVFIGQIKAAGIGLDGLQEICHYMIFVEVDWIPFKQCIGRLKRKGQKEKVIVQILVTKDSIEEQMLRSVNSKVKSIDKILGD